MTVGTVFEDSHIKLTKWVQAIYLIGASKKGISAHQLHRMLGVTYRAAWFMAHRLRYAMTAVPLARSSSGTVEVDEGYIGGKRKGGRAVVLRTVAVRRLWRCWWSVAGNVQARCRWSASTGDSMDARRFASTSSRDRC